MNIRWADAARHFLQVVAFCGAIAVLTTLIWPGRTYWVHLGHAATIGTLCWLVVEFGRYLVDERHCHAQRNGGAGWPKGWRGLLLMAAGIACSALFGEPIAEAVWGEGVTTSRDDGISLAITILAGGAVSFFFYARSKAAALSAQVNAVERDAGEAKLKLLETQLEPHMLFNTLANLRALITLDPPRAVRMLDHLNSYLRATLSGSRTLAHPLAAEFDRLGDYLELMSVRMGPRLRYTLELAAELRDLPVPPLLLQPLVENAIRHGLEPKVEGGEISVRARRDGERLVIEVNDTGIGVEEGFRAGAGAGIGVGAAAGGGGAGADVGSVPFDPRSGFGLAQVRERLATVYGERGTIRLMPATGGGTCALVTVPL